MSDLTENEMRMQTEINALKAEIKGLKEFVRALYTMIADDDDGYEEYTGGVEIGRFNT